LEAGSRAHGETTARVVVEYAVAPAWQDWELAVPGHNFAILVGSDGSCHVYGGRATSATTGVHHFTAASVAALAATGATGGTLVASGAHDGCLEGRRAIKVCEWDGKMSAAAVRGGRVALYGRFNTAKQHRWVQVALANTPAGPFGGFSPVQILGWSPCDVRRASVYYAAVNRNPADASTVLGLFPVFSHHPSHTMDMCYLGAAVSCDAAWKPTDSSRGGGVFEALYRRQIDLVSRDSWTDRPRSSSSRRLVW